MNKSHVLSGHTEKFGISSKLQEVICLLAQSNVFEGCEETLAELLGVQMSAKQIQRVGEHYGQELEELEAGYQSGEKDTPALPVTKESPVYAMMDGSMIFTREESWKEMKMARLYSESARVPIRERRTEVIASLYVCTLGNSKDFFKKLEPYVDCYRHKVFIADGAKWIWNWADDFYGDAVQILDYFHAVERLGTYATLACKDVQERKSWLDTQKQRLKNDQVEEVIALLKQVQTASGETAEALKEVIGYYENNKAGMKYKTFSEKGYLIGSGAVESAHRNVIQQHLKLSGQGWSLKGVQQIASLRACRKSDTWRISKMQLDAICHAPFCNFSHSKNIFFVNN